MPLYHGTNSIHLADIMREGLVPKASRDNEARVALYLTDDFGMAEMYAELAVLRRGGTAVIVEVDPQMLRCEYFEPDDYEVQNYIDDLNDPDRTDEQGAISGMPVDERLRGFAHWQEVPAELSLAVTRQVVYSDRIGPEALSIAAEPQPSASGLLKV